MRKLFTFFFLIVATQQLLFQTGCAHIVPPAGGDRDTLPPIPIKFSPLDSTLKFSGNKITIDFNEYIQLDKPFENVIVSPNPSKQPQVESRLRTLTIKLKDSLLPNTTYNIDFGSAVKDINEGNVLRDFIFVFSTGNFLDTRELHGKVILAETGKTDSTLIVILHKSLDDSTVAKQKPFYYTRVRGDGSFRFTNLPAGIFALYALKDANGNKQYDQKMELFAFLNEPVTITDTTNPVFLYAYSEEKDEPRPSTGSAAAKAEKKLLFQTNLDNKRQSLISPLEITFNTPLKYFDSTKISLVDTGYHPIAGYRWVQDSGEKTVKLQYDWKPSTVYKLISLKDFAADTLGNQIAKNDTIEFVTKRIEDYGSLRLDFKNFNKEKNPVLQFVQQGNIVKSFPITQNVWSEKLFAPGEYEIRVLYDDNKNGKWDAGKFFTAHKQPERVVLIEEKLAIHANWENENAIDLKE
ncbi:MAG TPA: Ig-like domain-containing protein [Chitinophagaceae bacterium]|nr:Ig-like domain-containing protein [Chitinophagaceae bacterium]